MSLRQRCILQSRQPWFFTVLPLLAKTVYSPHVLNMLAWAQKKLPLFNGSLGLLNFNQKPRIDLKSSAIVSRSFEAASFVSPIVV